MFSRVLCVFESPHCLTVAFVILSDSAPFYTFGVTKSYRCKLDVGRGRSGGMEWISILDRVPEEKGSGFPLIVCGIGRNDRPFVQGDAWYEDGKFWEWDSYGVPEQLWSPVTHWMPLPEPPAA
jgi:hypothetical protein